MVIWTNLTRSRGLKPLLSWNRLVSFYLVIWTNLTRSRGLKHTSSSVAIANLFSLFKQIWPDQGDWNSIRALVASPRSSLLFEQIWPDLGDWNNKSFSSFFTSFRLWIWTNLTRSRGLKREGVKLSLTLTCCQFEQIWPDLGDWNSTVKSKSP